jgi:hypothetical protein
MKTTMIRVAHRQTNGTEARLWRRAEELISHRDSTLKVLVSFTKRVAADRRQILVKEFEIR